MKPDQESDIVTHEELDVLWSLRDMVLVELETLRQNKLIGKSLDASVTLTGTSNSSLIKLLLKYKEDFREMLNVSSFKIQVD